MRANRQLSEPGKVGYYDEGLAQGAMAVVAKWLAESPDLKVVYHDGTAVDADIFKKVIRVPRLACSGGLDEQTLWLLRHRCMHEAAHISDTKLSRSEYPSGALFEVLNVIEDRRIERKQGERYPGARAAHAFHLDYANRRIAKAAAAGEVNAPLWEALVAMSFQSMGAAPRWRLSEKAQKYFEAAYSTFCEWKGLKSTKGSLKLAHRVYDILKEVHEQDEPEEPEESPETPPPASGEQEPQQGGQESQEGQEEEQEGQESQEGQEESQEGQEQEGQESQEGQEESQEEGQEGQESQEEGQQGGQEGQEAGNQEADGQEAEGDHSLTDDAPQDGEGEEEREERIAKELDEEAKGDDLGKFADEDIEQALAELDPEDAEYLSRRDLDEHNFIEGNERDMQVYKENREQVASAVAAMVRAMEQALRARTRCRKLAAQRRGRIDMTRLTHIAKNLSKEVFCQTRKGEKLATAVEIIIDESGSMTSDYLPVRLVVIAVAEALTQLNIPFEITGTTTKYFGSQRRKMPALDGLDRTNPMIYNHYKTFEQPWQRCKAAIARTGSHKHNIDGEAVEYAARRLLARPEARKVVLSLSDGLPEAGHCNDGKMRRNLVRACERAREAGVEVYGFGVNTEDPRAYYGEKYFVHLPEGKLDVEFARSFAAILMEGRMAF